MTRDELRKLQAKFPLSKSTLARNIAANRGPAETPASEPQSDAKTLGIPVRRETTRSPRYHICFDVYACRPPDWDNPRVKELQDCLVEIGALPSDDWRTLTGEVHCHKVNHKYEERTEIRIYERI